MAIENFLLFDEKELNNQCITVICPICNMKSDIHLPRNILKKQGLTTISIPKDTICEHHFQIFLDKDLKVRGYQKVDFELRNQIKTTFFKCQLCNAAIEFSINDDNTYLNKKKYEEYFGTKLSSYKVAHYFNNELHVNNVLVDNKGFLHDYINSYKVKLEDYKNKDDCNLQFFKYTKEDQEVLETHKMFNQYFIFNIYEHWIFDIVSSPLFNSIELSNLLFKKIQEASKIYSEIPKYMNISIADKHFHLWISQSNIICINLKNELNIQWLNPILNKYIDEAEFDGDLISKSSRILMLNEFFDENSISEKDIHLIQRLIYDDLLFTKIRTRYKQSVQKLVRKLSSEFDINKKMLYAFFIMCSSVVEFLKSQADASYLAQFIEIIDFINKNKLIEPNYYD